MSSVEILREAQLLLLSCPITIRTDACDLLFLKFQMKSTLIITGRQALQYNLLFKNIKRQKSSSGKIIKKNT